jgi:ribosome-binding factor A
MTRRTERINHTLQRELGDLIAQELSDPRIPRITSVTGVECSPDLAEARVSVSILGSADERRHALEALASAAGFLRRALGDRIRMKQVPRLTFAIDTKIEQAAEMLALIDSVAAADRKRAGPAPQL